MKIKLSTNQSKKKTDLLNLREEMQDNIKVQQGRIDNYSRDFKRGGQYMQQKGDSNILKGYGHCVSQQGFYQQNESRKSIRRRRQLREIIQSKRQIHSLIKKELEQLQNLQQIGIEEDKQQIRQCKNPYIKENNSYSEIRKNTIVNINLDQTYNLNSKYYSSKDSNKVNLIKQSNADDTDQCHGGNENSRYRESVQFTNEKNSQKHQQKPKQRGKRLKQNHSRGQLQQFQRLENKQTQEFRWKKQEVQKILHEMMVKNYKDGNVKSVLKLVEESQKRRIFGLQSRIKFQQLRKLQEISMLHKTKENQKQSINSSIQRNYKEQIAIGVYQKEQQEQQQHWKLVVSFKVLGLALKIKNFNILYQSLKNNRNWVKTVRKGDKHYLKKLMRSGMRLLKQNRVICIGQQEDMYRRRSNELVNVLRKDYLEQLKLNCRLKAFSFQYQKLHYQHQLKLKSLFMKRLIKFRQLNQKYYQLQILLERSGKSMVLSCMKDRQLRIRQFYSRWKLLGNINKHRKWNQFVVLLNYKKLKTIILYNHPLTLRMSQSMILQTREGEQSQYQPSSQINTTIMKELKHYHNILVGNSYNNQYAINLQSSTSKQQQLHETIVQFSNPLVLHIKYHSLFEYLCLKKTNAFFTKFKLYTLQSKTQHQILAQIRQKQNRINYLIVSDKKRKFVDNLISCQGQIGIKGKIQYFFNTTIGYVPNIQNNTNRNNSSRQCTDDNSNGIYQINSINHNPLGIKFFKHYFINKLKAHRIISQNNQLQHQVYYKTIFGNKLLSTTFNQWKYLTIQSKHLKEQKQKLLKQQQQRQIKERQQRQQLIRLQKQHINQLQQRINRQKQIISQQQQQLRQQQQLIAKKQEQLNGRQQQQRIAKQQQQLMLRRIKQNQQIFLQKEKRLKQQQQKVSAILDEIKNNQTHLFQIQTNQNQTIIQQKQLLSEEKQSMQKLRDALSKEKLQIEERRMRLEQQIQLKISIQKRQKELAKMKGEINQNEVMVIERQKALLERQKMLEDKWKLLEEKQQKRVVEDKQKQRVVEEKQQQRIVQEKELSQQKDGDQQELLQQEDSIEQGEQQKQLQLQEKVREEVGMQQQQGVDNNGGQRGGQFEGYQNEYSQFPLQLNDYSQSPMAYDNDYSQLSQNAQLTHLLTKRLSESMVSKFREDGIIEQSFQHAEDQQIQTKQKVQRDEQQQRRQQLQEEEEQEQHQDQQQNQQEEDQQLKQSEQSNFSDSSNQIITNHINTKNQPKLSLQKQNQISDQLLQNTEVVVQQDGEGIHGQLQGDMGQMMNWLGNKIYQNTQAQHSHTKNQYEQIAPFMMKEPTQNESYLHSPQHLDNYQHSNHQEQQQQQQEGDFFKMLTHNSSIINQPNIQTSINNSSPFQKQSHHQQLSYSSKQQQEQQEQSDQAQGEENSEQQSLSQEQQDCSSQQSQLQKSDRLLLYASKHHQEYIKRVIFNEVFKHKCYQQQQSLQHKLLKRVFTEWKLYHQQKHSLKKYLLIYESLNNKLKHINQHQHQSEHQSSVEGVKNFNRNKHSQSLSPHKHQPQISYSKPQSLYKKQVPNSQQQQPQSPAKIKFFPTSQSDIQQFNNLYPSNS